MTTNEDFMGDLLRFPRPDERNQPVVESSVVPDPHTNERPADADEPSASRSELATDTERSPVPAALAGKAALARAHLREHGWDYTKTSGKFLARHGIYLLGGAWDTASSVYARWTGRDIDAEIRAARAAGDHGTVADLMRQRTENKKLYLERLQVWGKFLVKLPIALGGLAGLTLVLTLLTSVIAFVQPGGLGFVDVWNGLFAALEAGFDWAVWAASWAPWAGLATVLGLLVQGYNRRRTRGDVPAAFRPGTAASHGDGAPITPSAVALALKNLGIKQLKDAVAEDPEAGASLIGSITLSGCGVEFDVYLPRGVDTAQIQDKRKKLAENLDRHEHEVFVTVPERARTVRLWVADSGALDEPIGDSPLVLDPEFKADFYTGRAPWGQTLRGEVALVLLKQMHLLMTGLSNQGKTAALRALALWLAMDPSVEFRIADLKGIGDWHMFKGLAQTLIEGPADEDVMDATHMLEWGVQVMEQRMADFDKEKYPDGVPADLARKPGSGFHPIILIVDEAQQAFMCPAVGDDKRPYGGQKSTSRYFMAARKLHNQGRAVNVLLWQGTQDPTDQNLPKLVREGAHLRASLVVGTEQQAKMALGDKAVDGGAAPHKLRQGKDKGTVVATGAGFDIPEGQSSVTIRTHFVNGTAATELAEAAKRRRGEVTTATTTETEQRDLLADVAQVLDGEDKAKATDVAARLRTLAPHYPPYRDLNADQLKDQLDTLGAKVTKSSVLWVYTERVHQALAAREGGDTTA